MNSETRNFDGTVEHRSANDLTHTATDVRNTAAAVGAFAPEFELTAVAELGYD